MNKTFQFEIEPKYKGWRAIVVVGAPNHVLANHTTYDHPLGHYRRAAYAHMDKHGNYIFPIAVMGPVDVIRYKTGRIYENVKVPA